MTRKKTATDNAKPAYVPTAQEKIALQKHTERLENSTAPGIKVLDDAKFQQIAIDHPHDLVGLKLLAEALGTGNHDFVRGLLVQLADAASRGQKTDQAAVNFMLSVVKGIQPRDEVESMLAAQMAAIHNTIMAFTRRLAHVENIPQQDSAERALNKLARTFTTQMEALKRYRTGGEQKVTVQHVSVSEGGQAIVGHVTQRAPGSPAGATPPRPALTHSAETPMPLIDQPESAAVPKAKPANERARRGPK
jgi:hypothetical protein